MTNKTSDSKSDQSETLGRAFESHRLSLGLQALIHSFTIQEFFHCVASLQMTIASNRLQDARINHDCIARTNFGRFDLGSTT